MAKDIMEIVKGAGIGGAVLITGLSVAGGSAASVQFVSLIPEMGLLIVGYAIAVGGALQLWSSFRK